MITLKQRCRKLNAQRTAGRKAPRRYRRQRDPRRQEDLRPCARRRIGGKRTTLANRHDGGGDEEDPVAAALIAFGTPSRAQLLPQQQLQQQPLSQLLQQQQLQLQQSVGCRTQCDSIRNSCTLSTLQWGAPVPVPDPHAACVNNCSQGLANCQQGCTGR